MAQALERQATVFTTALDLAGIRQALAKGPLRFSERDSDEYGTYLSCGADGARIRIVATDDKRFIVDATLRAETTEIATAWKRLLADIDASLRLLNAGGKARADAID